MFKFPDIFEVKKDQASPWQAVSVKPEILNEDESKKLFGIELAKASPFEAACIVFPDNTPCALWISQNWLNDPIVIAAKDSYKKTVDSSVTLLDKDQLAVTLLNMAGEKNASNTFYLLDGKDRLKALELYANIRGYLNKKDEGSTNNFINNQLVVKFIEPERKEVKQIQHNEDEILNSNTSPLKLKLVG